MGFNQLFGGGGGGATIDRPAVGATALTGRAQPYAAVEVYKGTSSAVLGVAFADAVGAWSLAVPAVALQDIYRIAGGGGLIVFAALGPLTASYAAGAAQGSLIATITGLSPGETVTGVFPNDGRFAFTAGAVTVGASASSAGKVNITVSTSLGRSLTFEATASVAVPIVAATNGMGALGNSWIGNGSAQTGTTSTAHPLKAGEAGYSGSTFSRSLPEMLASYLGQQAYQSPQLAYGLGGDTISASNAGPGATSRAQACVDAMVAANAKIVLIHACGNEVGAIRTADGLAYSVATVMVDLNTIVAMFRNAGIVVIISNVTPHGLTGSTGSGEFTGANLTLYQGIRSAINALHDPTKGIYVFDNIALVPGLCTDTNAMTYGPGFSPDQLHVHGLGMARIAMTFATWVKAQGLLGATPSGLTVPGATQIAGSLGGNPQMADNDNNGVPDGYTLVAAAPAGLTATFRFAAHPDNAALLGLWVDVVGTPTGTANTMVAWNVVSRTFTNVATAAGDKWSSLVQLAVDPRFQSGDTNATDNGLAGLGLTLRQDFNSGTVGDYLTVAAGSKVDTAPTTQLLDRVPNGSRIVRLTDPLAALPSDYGTLSSLVERVIAYFFVGVPVSVSFFVRGFDTRVNRQLAA